MQYKKWKQINFSCWLAESPSYLYYSTHLEMFMKESLKNNRLLKIAVNETSFYSPSKRRIFTRKFEHAKRVVWKWTSFAFLI